MQDKFDPLKVLASAFAISSVGGLAALLRSKHELNRRNVAAAFLYSGIMGLLIALLWFNYFDSSGNIYFLLGISGLAGVGGVTLLDFIIQVLRNGGVNIKISASEEDEEPSRDRDTGGQRHD